MFARLCNWLDNRTGYRKLIQALLLEHIPGGAKWRYVWGSCLAFVFLLQLITGVLLMTAYSPGNSTAWGSVYFIQYNIEFGWLIRGLHHFGSQTMVVLLGIHMLQVVIAGAHLPPREINWWLGLGLMGLILAMSLTGYLLPWDQKGYWATQVATSIAGSLPGIGSSVRTIIVGGPEYGHATLTRFYALHVAIIPALLVLLLIAHIAVFRRHGVTAPKDAKGEGLFWPDQAFRDMIACLAVFGIMLFLVIRGDGHKVDPALFVEPKAGEAKPATPAEPSWWELIALHGRNGGGVNLDAPADPGEAYPARPEWYFLFLFQLLKYFEGPQMIIGTVVIPNAAGLLLFLLPLFGYGKMRRLGHALGVIVVVGLLTAIASLTCLALADDMQDPQRRKLLNLIAVPLIPAVAGFFLLYLGLLAILKQGGFRKWISVGGGLVTAVLLAGVGSSIYGAMSGYLPEQVWERIAVEPAITKKAKDLQEKIDTFRHHLEQAEKKAGRAAELAAVGIPAEGAVLLLRRDPETQGPKLFKLYCGSCHSYEYKAPGLDKFHAAEDKATFKASDLAHFGTKEWILGLLKDPDDPRYFGHTPFKDMADWVANQGEGDVVAKKFRKVATWLATHPTGEPKKGDPPEMAEGYQAFQTSCIRCHSFAGGGGRDKQRGPDFTGYGSADWVRMMLTDPHDSLRYGRSAKKRPMNAMPLFRDTGAVTWNMQELQIDRQRVALLKPLLQEVPEDNKEEAARIEKQNKAFAEKVTQATQVVPLGEVERELIVRWLTGDHRVVFGGDPIRAAAKR